MRRMNADIKAETSCSSPHQKHKEDNYQASWTLSESSILVAMPTTLQLGTLEAISQTNLCRAFPYGFHGLRRAAGDARPSRSRGSNPGAGLALCILLHHWVPDLASDCAGYPPARRRPLRVAI